MTRYPVATCEQRAHFRHGPVHAITAILQAHPHCGGRTPLVQAAPGVANRSKAATAHAMWRRRRCMRRANSRALTRIRSGAVDQAFVAGSFPGERVCLSDRPEKIRNERPHRPSALSCLSPYRTAAMKKKARTCVRALLSSNRCGALTRRQDQRAAIFQSFAISANFGSLIASNAFCAPALSPLRFSAMPSSICALSASDRPPFAMAFCSVGTALA